MGRRFTLSFVPRGLLGRVLVRLLRWLEPVCLWQAGMLLQHKNEYVCVLLENTSVEIYVYTAEPLFLNPFSTHATAKAVFDTLVALLSAWYKIDFTISLLCTHCLQKRLPMEEVSCFSFADIASDVLQKGITSVTCGKGDAATPVQLDLIAPDIAMSLCTHKLLSHGDLSMSKKLGEGGMGSVYQGKYRGETVAIKELNASVMSDEKQSEEFRQEVSALSSLKHPNLLRMVGYSLGPCTIVLELLHGGDLYKYLHSKVPLSWGARTRIALDIARGVEFLHECVVLLLLLCVFRTDLSPQVLSLLLFYTAISSLLMCCLA